MPIALIRRFQGPKAPRLKPEMYHRECRGGSLKGHWEASQDLPSASEPESALLMQIAVTDAISAAIFARVGCSTTPFSVTMSSIRLSRRDIEYRIAMRAHPRRDHRAAATERFVTPRRRAPQAEIVFADFKVA